jgi:predicted  nucleic acid-binding Zn-ribbon protein
MGPTNVALVKLFRADQALREAQERLDAATKNVRIQERKTHDLAEKLKLSQAKHKELLAKSGAMDLDMRTRDAHIEKLRTQQQSAKNNKEYQAFLVEINTEKVDRSKVEEDAMKVLEESEKVGKEVAEQNTMLESERGKLNHMKSQMSDTIAKLQGEIDQLKAPREEAGAALPKKAREVFDRLADHHEGEAMSAIMKPDRRKEEYVCSACMMDLVTDVYNRLHTRDEMVFCPSCRRILYIPDELPPELAVNKKKAPPVSSSASSAGGESGGGGQPPRPKEPSRAKGKLGQLLTAAQGESVKNAVDADQKPLEFQVTVDGKVMGVYKGKTQENLERVIKFRMDEAKLTHEVKVEPAPVSTTETPEAPAGTEATAAQTETNETPAAAPEAPAAVEPAETTESSSSPVTNS